MGKAGLVVGSMVLIIHDYRTALAAGKGSVGGKAWNLARAAHCGFDVPEGFVIDIFDYNEVLLRPEVAPLASAAALLTVDQLLEEDNEIARECQQAILRAAWLPQDLLQIERSLGRGDILWAVRSSATGEDGDEHSFAGAHESVLNVSGVAAVAAAIRQCQASLWSRRAIAYRRRFDIPDAEVQCAVLVCAMIGGSDGPVAAGVAMTADPRTGERDIFMIEAVPGLADKLVSGAVEPQSIRLGIGLQEIAEHEGFGDGGLLGCEVRVLARLMQRVHWTFGQGEVPQDIEWAWDGCAFWILQVRPATAVPRPTIAALAHQPVIWSNANLSEVLPELPTPFSWSVLKFTIASVAFDVQKACGYKVPAGLDLLRRFSGRPYLDVSALQWIAFDSIATKPSFLAESLGGDVPEIQIPKQPRWLDSSHIIRIIRQLRLLPFLNLNKYLSPTLVESDSFVSMQSNIEFSEVEELATVWISTEKLLARLPFIYALFAARFWMIVARELAKRFVPLNRVEPMLAGLMAGASGVTSADHAYALQDLARMKGDHHQVEAAWQAFFDRYGHRGFRELELASPRWAENPADLRALVEVLAGTAHDRQSALAANARAQVELQRAPLPLRLAIRWATARAADAYALREAAKSSVVALLGVMRRIALEVGRRLEADGTIAAASDVFFLSAPDVIAYLEGNWDGKSASALTDDRRAEHAVWSEQAAPGRAIFETGDTLESPSLQRDRTRSSRVWQGIPASPGKAIGNARFVKEPEQPGSIQRGDIIVARATDPGWTPLFLVAGGLAVENGGYLSHAAIVAREFGLPAVVNLPGIVTQIDDGVVAEVDGDTGRVTISARP